MPITIVMDPRIRSMASRNLRGVGMKGTGMISTTRVVVRLNDSVVIEWLRYVEHCADSRSVDSYKRRQELNLQSLNGAFQ
jgi:hypothetical protein